MSEFCDFLASVCESQSCQNYLATRTVQMGVKYSSKRALLQCTPTILLLLL